MDQHFTKSALIKYSLPSIAMMLAISCFAIVSGYFISNFCGEIAFAAENLIWPLIMIFSSIGLMVGTGSSAIIANKLGENDKETASRYFSMFVYFAIAISIVLTIVGLLLVKPVAVVLGAEGELLELSVFYGICTMSALPGYLLQMAFLAYFNTAGKPQMGFVSALLCGLVVTVLDIILVVNLNCGLNGALIALVVTMYLGGIFPFLYFCRKNNKSYLRIVSPKKAFKNENPSSIKLIIKASINGSSETVQNVAIALVALLVVYQLNRMVGDWGIIAYSVIDYAWLVFNSILIGFSIAVAPLMSFQQGAKNTPEMHSLFKNCFIIICAMSVLTFAVSMIFTEGIVDIFVGYNAELAAYSTYAFRIYAISFLFCGVSIYGSSLFTSLENGLISALIAFIRTLLFETVLLIVFPIFFGANGIWWAPVAAEIMATILTISFIIIVGKRYGILGKCDQNG